MPSPIEEVNWHRVLWIGMFTFVVYTTGWTDACRPLHSRVCNPLKLETCEP